MAGPILGVGKVALNELRQGDEYRIEDRVDHVESVEVALQDIV